MKVLVYHSYYGCDTGCCGHVIQVDDDNPEFHFTHPYDEDHKAWAQRLVEKELGSEHVKDLDWDNCMVVDD